MDKGIFWKEKKKYIIAIAVTVATLVAGIVIGLFVLPSDAPAPKTEKQPLTQSDTDEEEPLTVGETVGLESSEPLSKTPLMKGIDVSKWQGQPDWAKVKATGVDFAMVRLGYRGENGEIDSDQASAYNLQKADENGILVGVYFFSRAKDEEDAKEEARWILERVGEYAISLPIVMDYEMMGNPEELSAAARTDTALSFLREIDSAGYDGMLYVPTDEFDDPDLWEKERILKEFLVWGARYDGVVYPDAEHPDEEIPYAMWQYSNTGRIDGISGNVDLDLAYFTRERSAPRDPVNLEKEEEDPSVKEFNQTFTAVSRKVTAKIEVNLRKIPSIDGELVATLKKGEYLLCTGDSDMGWSRLEYNGEKVYAVTSYLMDENGQSIVPTQSFQSVSEQVTAKIEVNLRREPSNEAEVVATLKNGAFLTRTGIGDKGWSRLDYNGETVYAVTSYLTKE